MERYLQPKNNYFFKINFFLYFYLKHITYNTLVAINLNILETLIANQKSAIKYQFLFALIVIFLGVFIILISTFFLQNPTYKDPLKLLLNIGGGFISTISAYPINQIIARKEKIKMYEVLMDKINDLSVKEIERVEELIWKSIEKIV